MPLGKEGAVKLGQIVDGDGNPARVSLVGGIYRLAVDAAFAAGITQVQNTESTAALGAGATFVGSSRDCINYESFGISVYVKAGAGSLSVTVLVENSTDGVTFRTVDSVTLSGGVGAAAQLNRVYSVCREFYRVSVTNGDGANALTNTEVISMLKPI